MELNKAEIHKIIDTLHPLERRIVPFLNKCNDLKELMRLSGLSEAEAMRALQWLENKQALKIKAELKETVQLDDNGKKYVQEGLPERRALETVKTKELGIEEIRKKTELSEEESAVCLGALKRKAAIEINNGIIKITEQGKKILTKEWLEEIFLKKISKKNIAPSELTPEEKFAFDLFKKRKSIIKTDIEKIKKFELTETGKKIAGTKIEKKELLERVTQEMLKNGSWKGKEFRRYDVSINVPKIYRGKRHFVNQATDYAKKIWLELGFKEMEGTIVNTCFWNFDALFTAQDHPVRDLQDTFYLKNPKKGLLPEQKTVKNIKEMHEHGGEIESSGWQYKWDPETAKGIVLRTHTTVLSAKTLSTLKKEDLPAKFFAVGRCFRNETLDWCHLFEFNQTEGIVVDQNANFRNLLGYLKRFFAKLGFPKARFRPAYFPYTEPSVEIDVFHPVHNKWIELGGAGMFRPEVVEPLLGEVIPVLAWGPGFDRIMLEYYKIEDIRELYKNDISQIRNMRQWMR